jgi:hypothetical protein
VGSGDARVVGELVDVAVRGAEVDPGVAAAVDPGLIEDLHAGGAQFGGCGRDVVDQEPGDRAGDELAVDRTVGPEDLDPPVTAGELGRRPGWPRGALGVAGIRRAASGLC